MAGNIHSGHRKRLRNRFDKVGFEGWSEHEVLEFLLFNVFRRCDTNALAHRLIDACGSLSGVLNSTQEALMEVDGVGEQTAYYLRMLGASFAYINGSSKGGIFLNRCNTPKYLMRLFAGKKHECFYLIMLDKNLRVLSNQLLFEGDFSHTEIDMTEIFRAAAKENPASIIAAHNHPSGVLAPSEADITTTKMIREALAIVGAPLREHYIVSGGECIGILEYMSKRK